MQACTTGLATKTLWPIQTRGFVGEVGSIAWAVEARSSRAAHPDGGTKLVWLFPCLRSVRSVPV